MAEDSLADDLLDGMSAICRYLNIKERQGYELAEKGRLPLFKFGGMKWQGRKSTLRRHIEQLEAGVKE
jgi:excisionase family DNA binding protein